MHDNCYEAACYLNSCGRQVRKLINNTMRIFMISLVDAQHVHQSFPKSLKWNHLSNIGSPGSSWFPVKPFQRIFCMNVNRVMSTLKILSMQLPCNRPVLRRGKSESESGIIALCVLNSVLCAFSHMDTFNRYRLVCFAARFSHAEIANKLIAV